MPGQGSLQGPLIADWHVMGSKGTDTPKLDSACLFYFSQPSALADKFPPSVSPQPAFPRCSLQPAQPVKSLPGPHHSYIHPERLAP